MLSKSLVDRIIDQDEITLPTIRNKSEIDSMSPSNSKLDIPAEIRAS